MADPEPATQPPKEVQAEVVKAKKPRRPFRANNPKVHKFIKEYAQGDKTMQQAALDSGLGKTPASASSSASLALQTPEIIQMYRKELDKQGLSPKFITRNIKRGIQKGKLSTSDRYLDIAMRLQGVEKIKEAPAQTFVSVVLNSITERGLDL